MKEMQKRKRGSYAFVSGGRQEVGSSRKRVRRLMVPRKESMPSKIGLKGKEKVLIRTQPYMRYGY